MPRPNRVRGRLRGGVLAQDVADFMLARLREWGVRTVFGYAGDGIDGLLAAWERAGNARRRSPHSCAARPARRSR